MSTSPHGTATFTKSRNHGVFAIQTNTPPMGLPLVAATTVSSDGDAQASLSLEITSTETDEELGVISTGGQPIEITYSDLGDGDHEVTILDDDLFTDDELVTSTVSGSSGSETLTVSGETILEKLAGETEPNIDLVARIDRLESGKHTLTWVDQTTYLKDVPERVEPGEEVAVTVYGWAESQTAPVSLMEDDPLLNGDAGEDEQIRHEEFTVANNYYEGTLTFTPSNYLTEGEDADRVLELDVRGESAAVNEIQELTVAVRETTTRTTTTSTTTTTVTAEDTTATQDTTAADTDTSTAASGDSDDSTETTVVTDSTETTVADDTTETAATTDTSTTTRESDDAVIQIEVPGFGMGVALVAVLVGLLTARWIA